MPQLTGGGGRHLHHRLGAFSAPSHRPFSFRYAAVRIDKGDYQRFNNIMIRRQARQRRDYLYRRALLLKNSEISEKRAKLRASLASGRPLDPAVASIQLRKDFQYDESAPDLSKQELLDLDDEYSELSGITDPRILVTTSRDPSSRLKSFAKEIRLLFPTGIRLNRGNLILDNLVASCKAENLSDLVILHEHRGVPSAMAGALCCEHGSNFMLRS
jgi:U3 small nucleolar ribonucleoprotein protein IMP4